MVSVVILIIVFLLIAVRQIGSFKLQIWQAMLLGAGAVLLSGQITPAAALRAVNLDVMLFLFGMFVIGQALEESGYLAHLSCRFLQKAKTTDQLILYLLFGFGLASAFLMNDTLAIIGTPVVLHLAKKHNLSSKLLLHALAFAVTLGSVMSPIGNPQNLLIAIHGHLADPFSTFLKYLLAPTLLNLALTYLLLKLFYRDEFKPGPLAHVPEAIHDPALARLARISMFLVGILILVKMATVLLGMKLDFRLTYIALISALPLLLFSPRRMTLIKNIDWTTLVFFAAMFVLMQSVWQSGFFQSALAALHVPLTSIMMILVVSVVLSQFISNVPLVALYLPVLLQAGASTREMVDLAAGSTIAGNLFILGAASNVIIIQNAESKSKQTLTFLEFAKVGIPLTILNLTVYWLFLAIP